MPGSFLRRLLVGLCGLAAPLPALAEERVPPPAAATHPMDALTADEIRAAAAILRRDGRLDGGARIVSLTLDEPAKAAVRAWTPGAPIARRAVGVVLTGAGLGEARIDLAAARVAEWKPVGNRQSSLLVEEMLGASELPKRDPRWQDAMRRRGITDFANVFCLPLAVGPEADPAMAGRRLLNVPCVDTTGAVNNLWGRPIEGVMATVDMAAGTVLSVTDLGVVPPPPETPSHAYAESSRYRPAPKPVGISAPQGGNIRVSGGQVAWDNWSFHVRLEPRLGTMLSLIRYDDHGTARDVAYQLSASEMFVPYMDPAPTWSFRAYMDVGEYGFGALATQLRPGHDCPDSATYLDLVIADAKGEPVGQRGVVCLFERPTGDPVWRHDELVNGSVETRPNTELVVRMAPVVGNYDYLVDTMFDRAGSIDVRLGAYGIDATKGVVAASLSDASAAADTATGTLVAPRLLAVNHDHYMAFRLDLDVDGPDNRFVADRYAVRRLPEGGTRRSLWAVRSEAMETEGPVTLPLGAAQFRVESATRRNRLGAPTSYQILPGHTATSLLAKDDPIQRRAGFTDYTMWTSAYAADEKYASGDYPNQNPEVDGLPRWTAAKRPIRDRDLVLWYTVGFRHVPRSEDWPAMPGLWHGFRLRPFNFFDRNPALDVPPAADPRRAER
ncbi:tyramine oxidase [Methylobacterium oryzihabitans]|uniref:Amine oxidase n=1 Tax=Methylobacterium oryzihabitans TaxID=2499852 RepID=A0A437P772_9HYPH|nr:tyramine oxidase [Methylobacterium oryzihabitans]RVU18113.1 tyramine oxidase [Methylobacterium oryzihabitans]